MLHAPEADKRQIAQFKPLIPSIKPPQLTTNPMKTPGIQTKIENHLKPRHARSSSAPPHRHNRRRPSRSRRRNRTAVPPLRLPPHLRPSIRASRNRHRTQYPAEYMAHARRPGCVGEYQARGDLPRCRRACHAASEWEDGGTACGA